MEELLDRYPAWGLHDFAWQYAEAAKKIACEPGLSDVAFFLTCHSIELALKAFLRAKGWEIDDLRRFGRNGHDLPLALQAAEKAGLDEFLSIKRKFRICLMVLNESYAVKDFEYICICQALDSTKKLRHLKVLLDGGVELLASTRAFVQSG